MTAERTVSIMKHRAERGLWNGGHVLGYRSSEEESGKLVIEPEKAILVRTIFDKFEELGSAGAVARHLSELGIRYPTYKTRNDKVRGGNLFQKQKITRILRAPVYIGRICWGETERDDCHSPIIKKEQFERVQRMLDETTAKRVNPRKPKGRHYLLTGLLRCSCGAHMVGFSARGRNRTHYYYSCTKQNHEGGKYSCDARRIPAEPLEEAVIEWIADIGREVEAREKIVERALEMLAGVSKKLKQEEELLQRQQQKTRGDITKLLEVLKTLGAKGLESVESELRRLESEDRQLDDRIKELRSGQEPMDRLSRDARSFLASWEDVGDVLDAATDEERGIILRHYIDVLEIKPDDAKGETGTYRLKLFPEVRPDRGFGDQGAAPEPTPPDLPTKNGDGTPVGDVPDSLTDSGSVCITDRKAPRGGLNPNRGFVCRRSKCSSGTRFRTKFGRNLSPPNRNVIACVWAIPTSRCLTLARSTRRLNWLGFSVLAVRG